MEVEHVRRERLALGDGRDVARGRGAVRLLAPVEERRLSAVETPRVVEHDLTIVRDRSAQRAVRAIAEARVVRAFELGEQGLGAERPHHTIARDRVAAAGARVLHDLLAAAASTLAQLEQHRVERPTRIDRREPEIDGVARVARPHVGPEAPRLEAAAFGARQRGAHVERVVLDRSDGVLVRLVHGEREESVEEIVSGAQRRIGLALHDAARRARQHVASHPGARQGVAATARVAIPFDGEARAPERMIEHLASIHAGDRREASRGARVVGERDVDASIVGRGRERVVERARRRVHPDVEARGVDARWIASAAGEAEREEGQARSKIGSHGVSLRAWTSVREDGTVDR